MATKRKKKKSTPSKVVEKQPDKPWQEHAEGISVAWQKGIESILETGRLLIAAKDDLPHGSFLAMIQGKLPFGKAVAQRLMVIARHPVLSNTAHAQLLPPCWMTLHELTKLDGKLGEGTLAARIEDGTITPKTQRQEVAAWLRPDTNPRSTITPRNKYVEFLKSRLPQERYDELMAFRTVVGALGIILTVEVSPPALQQAS